MPATKNLRDSSLATNPDTESSTPTRCATHPDVETNLRCGKCERPICPKCLVFTPVGARCRTCANVKPLPVFQVGTVHYARAGAAALSAATGGGIAWSVVALLMPFLGFWLVLGQGYLSGELVSRAANRKRSGGLRAMAVAAVALGYVVEGLVVVMLRFPGLVPGPAVILQIALAQFSIVLTNILLLLVFALAMYIAATRV